MEKADKIVLKILYACGIVFFFFSFALCQDSAKTDINNFNHFKLNNNVGKISVGLTQKADTVKNFNGTKEEENSKELDTSGTKNDYLDESLGIGGLVIDHTQSKWGRDFVDLFSKSFNPPDKAGNYTIVIEEKPLPQFGTVILIKADGNYIYQKFIQPRYETIKMNAEQGAEIALSYLANYQQIQKDLQGEDLKGTGIY